MKIIYLAAPLGAKEPERTENIRRAIRWYQYIITRWAEEHHRPVFSLLHAGAEPPSGLEKIEPKSYRRR